MHDRGKSDVDDDAGAAEIFERHNNAVIFFLLCKRAEGCGCDIWVLPLGDPIPYFNSGGESLNRAM